MALLAGKLVLAKKYADKAMQILIHEKRIPQIKILMTRLNESGLLKNKIAEYEQILFILQGKKPADFESFEFFTNHPEHWKYSRNFLEQFLLINETWDSEIWKLCYEYILLHGFNSNIFLALREKAKEKKDEAAVAKIESLLLSRNIKFIKDHPAAPTYENEKQTDLYTDYDQIAMDVISGNLEPGILEQNRVINSLKFISDEELKSKGQEMTVAFELLGMELVVISLCERLVKIIDDVKQRASLFYVWGQALLNLKEYYKSLELVDSVLACEPLYGEETVAFLYLKAEACFKLNKFKAAKEAYLEIKKENPNYRLVRERLKALEKHK